MGAAEVVEADAGPRFFSATVGVRRTVLEAEELLGRVVPEADLAVSAGIRVPWILAPLTRRGAEAARDLYLAEHFNAES